MASIRKLVCKVCRILPFCYMYTVRRHFCVSTLFLRNQRSKPGDVCDGNSVTQFKNATSASSELTERQYNMHRRGGSLSLESDRKSNREIHAVLFENALRNKPNKEGFLKVIGGFISKDKQRRGHVKFIYTAMKYMEDFDVQNDLMVYNELLDVIPKGKYHNKTILDIVWPKPHPQIDCALELLTLMEDNGIRPDNMTYTILLEVFGKASQPIQKIKRLAYWFDKYENVNPYKLPPEIYKSKIELYKTALLRISNNTDVGLISTYICDETTGILNDDEKSLLLSVHNPEFLEQCEKSQDFKSLYVEGPFTLWINRVKESYFVLKTGAPPSASEVELYNDKNFNEGTILGICMTNLAVPDSLKKWIVYLQDDIPMLKDAEIIFDLKGTNETAI